MSEVTGAQTDISDVVVDTPVDVTHNRVDVSGAIKLRLLNGLTYKEIADHYKVSKQAVHKALQPFVSLLTNPGKVKTYQGNRADLFDAASAEILKHAVDPAKLKQGGTRGLISSLETLYKMMRLETDQSTENIANKVHVLPVSEDTQQRLDKLIKPDT